MQHVSVYVDDSDNAVLATIANKQGLSISSLVRTMVRAACDAAPAEIKTNAAAALDQAREDAQTLPVESLESSPWSGQSR